MRGTGWPSTGGGERSHAGLIAHREPGRNAPGADLTQQVLGTPLDGQRPLLATLVEFLG